MTPKPNIYKASTIFTFKINISNSNGFNGFISHIYIYPLKDNKRRFSTSRLKLSDIDKLINKVSKHKEQLENFRRNLDKQKEEERMEKEKEREEEREQEKFQELAGKEKNERTFLTDAKERLDELIDKQEKVEGKIIQRLDKGYEKLNFEKGEEILEKFEDRRIKVKDNINEKALELEAEFKGELKPVAYFQKKVDIEASGFKKLTQVFEKEEEEIDKQLKKESNYNDYKDKYEKERSEWKQEHQENVRICRQEKQDIKKHLDSNLEKASVMAEDLVNETGPDYTGGDD